VFVLHRSAAGTIEALRALGFEREEDGGRRESG
jgi:hypothetical protein